MGRSAAICGDQILEIMLVWAVWQLTQSSTLTGLAVFIQRAPFWLFGFVGATFTDRLGALPILKRANGFAILVAALATLAMAAGSSEALTILCAAFAIGCARAFESPALTAIVPALQPVWSTKNLNNLLDNAKRLGRLVAPFPAMLLGKTATFLVLDIAAASFAIMVTAATVLSRSIRPATNPLPTGIGEQLRAIRTICASRVLAAVLVCSAVYALFHGAAYFVILPRILLEGGNGEAGAYASVIGAFAFGGIAANLIIAWLPASRSNLMVGFGMFVAGLAFLLVGQTGTLALQMAIGLAGGASFAFQDVFIITLIQKHAAATHLARAHALWRLGSELGLGAGVLLGGIAADNFDAAWLLLVVGASIGLVSLVLVLRTSPEAEDRHPA
ncbi:MFS transporter [Stappia sp. F7233]|uniref:MFS transporter n=1 Tax=Stappia albiluteola TaxID=2758565 RepID=A0A839AHA7_9HYPH|nr:MFS transporter [Stappia albiluteola]MBA5778466.1 MFS transporter [Stappia albiluteola]